MNNIGHRIAHCRKLLNLTREGPAKSANISIPTLSRWELNYIKLSTQKEELLYNFLAKVVW